MLKIEQIFEIELDITSFCNAECPECARTLYPTKFQKAHLSKNVWDKIIELPNLNHIIFNGNFGDFIMHPSADLFLLELSRVKPHLKIQINTNGATRPTEYWSKLAKILCNFDNHSVIFSIDGLYEEYENYRVNCSYSKVLENAKAFINVGGQATWSMILFETNLHQLEDAKRIAKSMNFSQFKIKKSYCEVIKDSKGRIFKRAKLENSNVTVKDGIPKNFCITQDRYNLLFVDHTGKLWPCCWTADPIFQTYFGNSNDLNLYSFEEILSSDFSIHFDNEISSISGHCENYCRKKYV